MKRRVKDNLDECIQLLTVVSTQLSPQIVKAAETITAGLLDEKKVLACGNGGSAADVQHFASKMLNRYEMDRPGLPAIALTADSVTLTSIANDYQFADVFSKQIRALGQPGDILLAITTSGESVNIVHAIDAARDRRMKIIALTGREGGQITDLLQEPDIELRVPSWSSARIQEIHIIILNAICDLIDQFLLGYGE
jgi:D-sedoheptulose 7-phosphate isomerase